MKIKYNIGDWLWYERKDNGDREVVKGKIHTIHYYGDDEASRYGVEDKDYHTDVIGEEDFFTDQGEALTEFWENEVQNAKQKI